MTNITQFILGVLTAFAVFGIAWVLAKRKEKKGKRERGIKIVDNK